MVCSQLLIKWNMGGAQQSIFATSLINLCSNWVNRMTKKAALGGPSSDDTFPLREKTKF